MSIADFLFGQPLSSAEEGGERIGAAQGIPIFGLDALSSAAYGPEAALTLLLPLGLAGPAYVLPISTAIIILLIIVFFSYYQTIGAYPGGGGSYTVAKENLGVGAGLLAASALLIDYVLVVAVGISAGVGALVSAVPSLQPHTLEICLGILAAITLVNLRGVRDTGVVFMVPTYLFVGTLLAAIVIGTVKTLLGGGHPAPVIAPPAGSAATAAVGTWLLLKAFASGCTAMTGVEAVSNGVKAFREPAAPTARKTLTVIIALLIVLLAGIAYLVRAYGIVATDPGQPGYQSVISMIVAAVVGRGVFYYVTIGSVLVVLALSANTAFAGFPRLCRIIALDGYLPSSLAIRGRRLVYSEGVYGLAVLAGLLLVIFGGVTDRLIPLFAVGAFLAFTLSQAGMVAHWSKVGGRGSGRCMALNACGALATGITVVVVLVAKFVEGAWVTMLLIPGLLVLMTEVRRHYRRIVVETASDAPLELKTFQPPLVVVPLDHWSRLARQGLTFALNMSPEVTAVYVDTGECTTDLEAQWCHLVEMPALEVGMTPPKLVRLKSPYRFIIWPIVDFVLDLQRRNPGREIAVVIPELVERQWYYFFLHTKRAAALKGLLYVKGSDRIAVINVPWYVSEKKG